MSALRFGKWYSITDDDLMCTLFRILYSCRVVVDRNARSEAATQRRKPLKSVARILVPIQDCVCTRLNACVGQRARACAYVRVSASA